MENEVSIFNVIHWECNLNQLKKPARFDVQIGVTGGWLDTIAILRFKWRVMCIEENLTALHFVAEDSYSIPNLASFDESKMKALYLKSYDNVNNELGIRTKGVGNVFIAGITSDVPSTSISMYYKEFLQAIKAH